VAAVDFWNDPERARRETQELKGLQKFYQQWDGLVRDIAELDDLVMLFGEEESEQTAKLVEEYERLAERFRGERLAALLDGEHDRKGAFLSIHAGAGGTESCDWARMLLRMYQRWCERHAYSGEVRDVQEAEGGIKSVTIEIEGMYVYGYLKGESGVHRLVRISPFDSGARRHTSFSSVHIIPIINEEIVLDIKPDDIRIDTYRASGAGGQHVNKTDSAVRITHLATNIVVQCQNERSQHMNREHALRMLRARLYQHYEEEQRKERAAAESEKKEIAWGSQIRSYVLHPYKMVKDHRFDLESGKSEAILDGDIDLFIEHYLLQR